MCPFPAGPKGPCWIGGHLFLTTQQMTPTRIYIKSVPRKSPQMRHASIDNVTGRVIGKSKGPGVSTRISIGTNPNTGKLNLGFDRQLDNKWFAKKKSEANLPNNWKDSTVWQSPKITYQTHFELLHDVPQGTYTSKGVRIGEKDYKPTYLQKMVLDLFEGDNVLNLEIPDHQIWYHYFKNHCNFVAASYEEYPKSNKYLFYISGASEGAENEMQKRDKIIDAMSKYKSLKDNHPQSVLFEFSNILQLHRGKTAYAAVAMALDGYISKDEAGQSDRIATFNKLYEEFTNEPDMFKARNLVYELAAHNVFRLSRGSVFWSDMADTDLHHIGYSVDQAIIWLRDPGNKEYLDQLKATLSNRKHD